MAIVERHGGVVPDDVAALEALPGIGTYTARAVACFGYGQPQPVVDTNVRRVVARLVHGRAEAGNARAADLADIAALTPADPARAARFSVAAMELGALVCVAGTPRCGACPVRDRCAWRLAGSPAARRAAAAGAEVRRHRPAGAGAAARRPARGARPGRPRPSSTPPGTTPSSARRCLDSLLTDGLVEQTADGLFTPPPDVDQVADRSGHAPRQPRRRPRHRRPDHRPGRRRGRPPRAGSGPCRRAGVTRPCGGRAFLVGHPRRPRGRPAGCRAGRSAWPRRGR